MPFLIFSLVRDLITISISLIVMAVKLALSLVYFIWMFLLGPVVFWLFGFKPKNNDIIGIPYIVDGDGLAFDGDIHVRLFGLDAPEMSHPEGKPSKDYLAQLVGGAPVRVVPQSVDKYKRIVGIVYSMDGEDLNARMVKDGYARAYSSFSKRYTHLERKAKRSGAGLWGMGGLAIHPEIWRKHMK
jgi:endonuclease YncB( thermonuclease family)